MVGSKLKRTLKIESVGDQWKGFEPKIRLKGQWLANAGFKPGEHVQVLSISPGLIQLRSMESAELSGYIDIVVLSIPE
jgi:hypothetical protein